MTRRRGRRKRSASYVHKRSSVQIATCYLLIAVSGCAQTRARTATVTQSPPNNVAAEKSLELFDSRDEIRLVAHETSVSGKSDDKPGGPGARRDSSTGSNIRESGFVRVSNAEAQLEELESAIADNPRLRRLSQEYQAAVAKVRYIDELPDPTLGTNAFVHPIETAAGSQRANIKLTQMLPWLPRLDARTQQACFQAAAIGQVFESERLQILARVRAQWFRLYVLHKQIEILRMNQTFLESLIDVANARVSTGQASQGDVLSGTLEYSQLEEQILSLKRMAVKARSSLNRLIGRDVSVPIPHPESLSPRFSTWDAEFLRELAWAHQPEIEAARIRQCAARWGVEVARLQRRPDFTVNASWFAIDDNRPDSAIVDIGEDAWSVGATMTLPIGGEKYDAIEQEALWKHAAASSSTAEIRQEYDDLIVDLLEQARTSDATARLYKDSILPDANRTLKADLAAYSNGAVEFDRVMRDFRNLLTLEIGYHRAIGQLATSIAQLKQATGTELVASTDLEDKSVSQRPPSPRIPVPMD